MKKLIALLMVALPVSVSANNFLPADQAFKFGYSKEGTQITMIWKIEKGYHLYKDKIRFIPENAVEINYWPKGVIQNDGFNGPKEMFTNQLVLTGSIVTEQDVYVSYQGCKLKELCYMPLTKPIN